MTGSTLPGGHTTSRQASGSPTRLASRGRYAGEPASSPEVQSRLSALHLAVEQGARAAFQQSEAARWHLGAQASCPTMILA